MTDVELRQDASAEYVKGWNDGIAARKELDDLSAIDPVALEPRSLGRNEMSEVSERWHDWRYDGRGYYLVNDPEITFQDDAEADAYCDEHNRALVGQAAAEERAKVVAWLRSKDTYDFDDLAIDIDAGEHLK